MAQVTSTSRQLPDHAILDHFNKQTYLGNDLTYTAVSTSSGTTEVAVLLLSNPPQPAAQASPNGKGLFVSMARLATLTATNTATMRVYLNPTVTGAGTAQTPANRRPSSTLTPTATVATAPTASANGKLVAVLAMGALQASAVTDLFILDPSNTLLVTIQTSATATSTAVTLNWSEI